MHILLTVFIIVGGICRALEVIFNIDYIANAMQWPYLVHIFRIMSFIMDLIQSTTLLIFYVIIPVRDTIGVRKWRATVDVARVDCTLLLLLCSPFFSAQIVEKDQEHTRKIVQIH